MNHQYRQKVINRLQAGLFILLLTASLMLPVGCKTDSSVAGTTLSTAAKQSTAATQASATLPAAGVSLKIGVMPAVDSAPIFIASQKGYFTDLGLTVEVQVYTSAMNRQSALQSGALDGAMTDVIALVNNVENGFDIKVTTSTDGVFPFLLKKGFAEKKDIKAGMMEVSVTNYLSDRCLSSQYSVEKIYINEIPARLEMINAGNLDMAVIPEPMASQGELGGLTKRLYTNSDAFSPDVMVFTGKAIKDNEKAVRLFHQAYNKAVQEINRNDGEARDMLIATLKLNPAIKDKILMPKYNLARVPSPEYLQQIMEWNERVLKKKISLKYTDLVEGKFVS